MVDVSGAQRLDTGSGRVCTGESPGYWYTASASRGRYESSRKGDGLAVRIKMVVVETERQIVIAMAKVS